MNPILKGALTYAPGVKKYLHKQGFGSTHSATYCYGVWLKHIVLLNQCGYTNNANVMAELGPGGSLGLGLAGVLSGINKYYALDVVKYVNVESNLKVLDELIELFRSRASRPTKGWPDFDEYLSDDLFPHKILTDELLEKTLAPKRIDAIRAAIRSPGEQVDGIEINYQAPWSKSGFIKDNSVDLLLSQSTLEHVEDLPETYEILARWMKSGGWMSHQIDFQSHGISEYWDGYRKYSEFTWRIVKGKRQYLINRAPQGDHLKYLTENGFNIELDLKNFTSSDPQLPANQRATRWKNLTEHDLNTISSFLVSRLG